MSKINLNDFTRFDINSAVTNANLNNTTIEEAFDNTISRDGSTPNQMEADFDLNGNDVLNGGGGYFTTLSASGAASVGSLIVDGRTLEQIITYGVNTPIREVLDAPRTYYVRTDGNDSNDGLTDSPNGAFLTRQKAIDVIAALDRSIYTVTMSIGAGTFTDTFSCLGMGPGSGAIELVGAGISDTIIAPASGNGWLFESVKNIRIRNMRITATGSGGSAVSLGAQAQVSAVENVDFGPCASRHFNIRGGSLLSIVNNITISGGALNFIGIDQGGGYAVMASNTVTITGTPAFSAAFIEAGTNTAHILMAAVTFSGSATGSRYRAANGGLINSNGLTFPGDASGTGTNFSAAPWGLYT